MGWPGRTVLSRVALVLAALLACTVSPWTSPARAATHPATDDGVVTDGPVRVRVLTPTLLRLEYAADRKFEDRPTFVAVARDVPPPEFSVREVGGELRVRTSQLLLRYRKGSGPFSPANTTVELTVGRNSMSVHPQFGSPDRADALGGWYRGLDYYADQAGSVDQLTLHQGVLTREGWYLLDDTTTAVRNADGWPVSRPAHGGMYQDGYFFGYGHDYKAGLRDLRRLTGPSDLLPKWAFGVWFSEYNPFTSDDYRNSLLPAFRQHNTPLDVLVADTDWKAPNTWAGWNWNPSLFPDPKAFLDWATNQQLQVALNVHAAISANDPRYAQAQALAGGGLAPATRSFAPQAHRFDWSDPAQAAAWNWLHQPFERQGVRQWWLDYCCDNSTASTPGLTPDSWVNELYRRDGEARGLRGFSLARIGGSYPDYKTIGGSGAWAEHRSTVQFTGDTKPDWPTLAYAAAMTPAEGSSIGLPYVSHDIGSFAGRHLPADLYLRWVQLGVFQPVLRLHSDHGDRLPWQYSDVVSGPTESLLRLRESLAPYLYAVARQAYDTGLPMTRALYLDWPELAAAYTHSGEYMLGDQVLVAPITSQGLATASTVWLPPGTWTDLFTGATYQGPAERTVVGTPNRMPVFVRAGGVLPLAADAPNIASQPADALTLRVFPHGPGSTALYDDAGEGLGYRHGEYASTPVRYTEGGRSTLVIGPAHGRYPGQPVSRQYTVQFADVAAPHEVTIDGEPTAYRYDAGTRTLTVNIPHVSAEDGAVVAHDGRPLTVTPPPAVDFSLVAPDGLVAGTPSRVIATVRNAGPGDVTGVAVTLPQPTGWTVTPTSPTRTGRLAQGGTFTATFEVTPARAARNTDFVGHVGYQNPDGSVEELPSALTVAPRPVRVTFRTVAPAGTPPNAALYLPGNIDQLGPWDPGKLAMTNKGGGTWEANVTILDGTELQYKYTRGNWDMVEWWGGITGFTNRFVTVDGGTTGTMLVDDTATNWSDRSTPDVHKAPQYWRDPLVVSTGPPDGATGPAPGSVAVRFQRDVDPAGANFTGSVSVTRAGSAVAGSVIKSTAGVLTWTPSAALPPGNYQVVVSGVKSALGSDGVPMQAPYRFTFTVT